ncbi:Zinc finger protein JACKDAW [Linum grandiflorum]
MMSSGGGDPFSLTLPPFFPPSHEQPQLPPLPPPAATNPNPNPPAAATNNNRKRRNLPDPDAEVMALSPKSLMATNRFLCEICNKGFQRDQNLQLHRRGHNLPWKLKQRNTKEPIRKKVYICPEKTCVHHDPSRALGDLTGIKKHFSRKHGEKKWKCEKCSKKYAVLSDWKAHSKTCGTREYKCDCGTLFSRKDSFITHRAFCDALADDSLRFSTTASAAASTNLNFETSTGNTNTQPDNNLTQLPRQHHGFHNQDINSQFGNFINSMSGNNMMMMMPNSNNTSSNNGYLTDEMVRIGQSSSSGSGSGMKEEALPSLYSNQMISENKQGRSPMSATALLQKAAQIGSTRSSSSHNNSIVNNTQSSSLFGGPANSYGVMMSGGGAMDHNSFEQLMMMQGSSNDHHSNNNNNNNYSSDSMESRLTRDFLGMSGRPFLQQEIARFANSMSSSSSSMGMGFAAANPL